MFYYWVRAVESLRTVVDDDPHAFLFMDAERRGQGGKIFKSMKTVLFILLFFIMSISFSMAQVNRYDTPAESTYGNTYVSPDYSLLFELGNVAKQRKSQIESLIQKAKELYDSYPKYPSVIEQGWHKTVSVFEDDCFIMETESYVNFNNEIEKINVNNNILIGFKDKIVKGKSKVGTVTVYFFEDIWSYNKNMK